MGIVLRQDSGQRQFTWDLQVGNKETHTDSKMVDEAKVKYICDIYDWDGMPSSFLEAPITERMTRRSGWAAAIAASFSSMRLSYLAWSFSTSFLKVSSASSMAPVFSFSRAVRAS